MESQPEETELESNRMQHIPSYDPAQLQLRIEQHHNECTNCGACQRNCAFLQKYGTPKHIVDSVLEHEPDIAFSCSLCGLCDAQCPEQLHIQDLFLQLRRAAIATRPERLNKFRGLRLYESIGMSNMFSCYALPDNCHSIFFPGCALAGNLPQQTWNLYRHLQQQLPNLGLVLDCCTKPSHDLGDQQRFSTKFTQLISNLESRNITQVLTACPNCYQVFKTYAPQLELLSVYQQLAQVGAPNNEFNRQLITVHDPCVNRFEPQIHQAVRTLLADSGYTIEEMTNHGNKTFCCGEGGCVMATQPEFADNWRLQRVRQSKKRLMTTYCAGCVEFLRPQTPTVHIIELLFDPDHAQSSTRKQAGSLQRYLNRLKLKRQIKKNSATQTGVRSMTSAPTTKKSFLPKLLILSAIIASIVTLKMTGAIDVMEPQILQEWILGYGLWAPLVFILLYSIAPALFLPGLPLTILAGVVFGPVWGVVYSIIGATCGASGAFLVARYLGRDWISAKLSDSRWQKLDEDVAINGWKVVAVTRLIPLFPFNLLNYAFGLTKIRFSHYVITSFFCMLPATIAFISLSSSVGQLLHGKISTEFVIGAGLLVVLSLLPLLWKKLRGGKRAVD